MTVYTITPATSIFSNGTVAFQNGSAAADILNVQTGAHVFAGGALGTGKNALWLRGPGAWTVSINGSVLSTEAIGLLLNPALALSTISIGTDGSIAGAFAAIEARSPVTITNRGELTVTGSTAGAAALRFFGTGEHRLTNYGVIDSSSFVAISDVGNVGTEIIDNRGFINGNILLGGGNDRLTNSGVLSGEIDFGSGNNSFNNSGKTYGYANYRFGSGNDTVLNSGQFIYAGSGGAGLEETNLGNGVNSYTNTATASNFQRVVFGTGNDTFNNAGLQQGRVDMGGGANRFTNSGRFEGSDIDGDSGIDQVTNSGLITTRSINLGEGNNILTNTGEILDNPDLEILFGSGNDTIINSGIIHETNFNGIGSNINFGNGANRLTNNVGGVIGVQTIFGIGNDTVTNAGTIDASFQLGNGTNSFTNTGRAVGTVTGGTGADTFTNKGVYEGDINLNEGADVFTNNGTITGTVRLYGVDTAGERFTNTGTINGGVSLGGGSDIALNSGTINGSIFMLGGVNRFTNSGVVTGSYFGGLTSVAGSNILTNFVINGAVKVSGTILGDISLSSGNDYFYGGDKAEKLFDSRGTDRNEFAGGDDTYFARFVIQGSPDGLDYADGGTGSDTLVLQEVATTIVNLDTVSHSYGPGFQDPNAGFSAANRVTSGGTYVERLFNFENVVGTDGSEIFYGNAAANTLAGGGGSDVLHGYAGNDTLDGGAGFDVLVGGQGRDVMTGGTEGDYFVFISELDSVLGANRDVITDFSLSNEDVIMLDAIDANTIAAGNNAFTSFIGTNVAFTANAPGTLRAVWTASGWIVEGNTDNDAAAEFQIAVNDASHAISWSIFLFVA